MEMLSVLFVPEVFLVWTSLAKTLGLLAVILGLVSYTVYAERKVCALIQAKGSVVNGTKLTVFWDGFWGWKSGWFPGFPRSVSG